MACTAGRARRPFPRRPPLRIGLTGSIGMGKSTVARMFADAGVPVFDADREVHRLLAPDGAGVAAVAAAFPGAVTAGRVDRRAIDRRALGRLVFDDAAALARLESILHPLVDRAERRFFRHCALHRRPLALCDIPLLFETGAEARFDLVVVVDAPALVQRQRVLGRPGMTPARLDRILDRQWPSRAKVCAADAVIRTGLSLRHTRAAVGRLLAILAHGADRGELAEGSWPRGAGRGELAEGSWPSVS